MKRRALLIGGGAVGAGLLAGGALYAERGSQMQTTYAQEILGMRSPLRPDERMREIVRYATLAATSHNAQAWRFAVTPQAIAILPDFSRRTPVVDPDDHHLFTSLGCAAENLVIAAAEQGMHGTAIFTPADQGRIEVAFATGAVLNEDRFAAITQRQVTRADYDNRPIASADLDRLLAAAQSPDVDVAVVTARDRIERILDLVVEGNTAQYLDADYVVELKQWLRFNEAEALAHRDGLFSGTSGNPTLPSWLGRALFGLIVTAKGENETVARQIRSSTAIVVFTSKSADARHWIEAGRSYQRFALEATVLGLKHAFINQAVEVPQTRALLASEIGLPGRRPDLIVRVGYGPEVLKSLRRSVPEVLV